MNYVKVPNLPEGPVSHVLCGYNERLLSALMSIGIISVDCYRSMKIHNSTANHADMLCNHLGNKTFVVDKDNDELKNTLRALEFNVVINKNSLQNQYPHDCIMNCVRVGDKLICNPDTIEKSLLFYYKNSNFKIIETNQGYTKCNVCIVNENSIITSDKSIYDCSNQYLDVLLIENGHIQLAGYDTGFIGGCSGLIDKNKLLFVGDIETHPSFKKIEYFLRQRNVEYVSLFPGEPLQDVGSIIPIIEYIKEKKSPNIMT